MVNRQQQRGFTLLEIMIVLFFIGLSVTYVMFNAFGANPKDKLEEQARRFQVIFEMASDFAVLNQQQLGLRVEKRTNEYGFMLLDDQQNWQPLDLEPIFAAHQLPEPFALELNMDDLPWLEEDNLFDDELFDEDFSLSDEGVEIGNEADKKPPPPQVLILSSGDLTPFSLTFIFEPDFGDEEPVYFQINGKETTPLERVGPLESL